VIPKIRLIFSTPTGDNATLDGWVKNQGVSSMLTKRSVFATEQHYFQSRNVQQEKLKPYSPSRPTNSTEGANEWSLGIGFFLGLAIHVISAISYLVWLNSRMHDLSPTQVDEGNIIGFAVFFCAPIGAFLGALAVDLTNRLTSARAGYFDNLNASGKLAHSDEADMCKATEVTAPEDVSL